MSFIPKDVDNLI